MNFRDESFIEKVEITMELSPLIAVRINDALRVNGFEPYVGASAISASVIVEELRVSTGARFADEDDCILAPYISGDVNDPNSHKVRGVALWRKGC
jgi:hypothetical protein